MWKSFLYSHHHTPPFLFQISEKDTKTKSKQRKKKINETRTTIKEVCWAKDLVCLFFLPSTRGRIGGETGLPCLEKMEIKGR